MRRTRSGAATSLVESFPVVDTVVLVVVLESSVVGVLMVVVVVVVGVFVTVVDELEV